MKKILLLFGLLVVTTTGLYAQVGIGTTDPLDSAQLEVVAKEKGILIPRLALTRTGDFNPVKGTKTNSLLVYNTGTNTGTSGEEVYPGYYYWYEGAWNRVISQGDFSNSSITNTILNKSNIVTYDPTNKTFNYYSTSGTTTSVSVIDVINNSPATQSISIEKIQPGTKSNTVLKTVDKGGKLVTEWTDAGNQAIATYPVKGSDGIVFDNGQNEVAAAVLKKFTIKVKDLNIDKLTVSGTTAGKGDILVVGDNNSITYTSTISADKIQKNNLGGESNSGITVENGDGIILGSKPATIKISGLPVDKLKTDKSIDKDKVLVTDASGTPKWDKLSGDNINGGELKVGEGLSISSGAGVLLKSATLSITNVDISKVTVSDTSYNDKLLMVKDKKVVATSQLPAGTTVSVTNVRTASPTAGTSTQVVTIDKNGVATVTTIEKLISSTISATNGLTMSGTVIELGGDITKSLTLAVDPTKSVAITIDGLTNTGTISSTVDKIMVLGKDNVLHTVSATAFKGSGDYIINKDGDSYSVKSDTTTGNTFTDSDGKKYPEKIRTVLIELKTNSNTIQVDPSASAAELSKLQFAGYTEGADSKILMADIRVFSKGAVETTGGVKRSVTYSAVTYSVKDGKGILNPGISSGGFSAPTYKGFYYVTIKYIDKTTPLP